MLEVWGVGVRLGLFVSFGMSDLCCSECLKAGGGKCEQSDRANSSI